MDVMTKGNNSLNSMLSLNNSDCACRQQPYMCMLWTHTPKPVVPDASVRMRRDGGAVPSGHEREPENVPEPSVCSHHRSCRRSGDVIGARLRLQLRIALKTCSRRGLPSGMT